MKNRIRTLLGFLVLTLAAPSYAEIIFRAEPPVAPDKARLLELLPTPVSHDLLLRRARELSGNPELKGRIRPAPSGAVVDGNDFLVWRNNFGTEVFVDQKLGQPDTTGKPISEEEAKRIAEDLVRKHFQPTESMSLNFTKVEFVMSRMQDLRSGELTTPKQEEAEVYLKYTLEDVLISSYSIVGSDPAKLVLGNDGSLRAAFMNLRRPRLTEDIVELLPYDVVRQELIRKLEREAGKNDAIVHEIEFGYFNRPLGEPQRFFQPAYVFYVSFFDPETKSETAARMIPMPAIPPDRLKEPLEEEGPPQPEPTPDQILWKAEPPQPIAMLLPAVQKVREAALRETFGRRATQLQLKPENVEETPRGVHGFDPNARALLFMDPNGAELLSLVDRQFKEPPGKNPPLPEREAVSKAMEWLGRFQDINKEELGEPVVRRLMNQTFDIEKQQPGEPTADEVIVEFPRVIRDPKIQQAIPFVGHGGTLSVHMNNLGEVLGQKLLWSRLGQVLEPQPVRPFEEVKPEFERLLMSELNKSIGLVTNIQMGLYERPEGFKQEFLQPVWLFTVEIVDPVSGETTAKRLIPLPATGGLLEPLDDPDASDTPPVEIDTRESLGVPKLYGDFDGDGDVDATDLVIGLRLGGGLTDAADIPVSGLVAGQLTYPLDDGISILDASRIARSLFGLDDISNGP